VLSATAEYLPARGLVSRLVSPEGHIAEFEYNKADQVTRVTLPVGAGDQTGVGYLYHHVGGPLLQATEYGAGGGERNTLYTLDNQARVAEALGINGDS